MSERSRNKTLAVAFGLCLIVSGVASMASEDTAVATADLTVDESLSCSLAWHSSGTSSVDHGYVTPGAPVVDALDLTCAHSGAVTQFEAEGMVDKTGAPWLSNVNVALNGIDNFWDEGTFGNRQPWIGEILSGDPLSETFDVTIDVDANQAPGPFSFTFSITITSL